MTSVWSTVAVKDVARVVGGATPKSGTAEYWDGDVPWTTPKDLSDLDGKFLSDTPRKITAAGLRNCSSELLPPQSVLFSSRAPIGHVAINTVPMATNQGFKSFVPGPKLDASFLYWWLKCHRAQLELLGNGATFKEVSKAIVERIEIPLPPLDEQKRIAAILDQADELRRKRQRAIDRLNQLGQAIFHGMFGQVVDSRASGIELGSLLKFVTSGGRGWSKYYAAAGTRFIRSLDVQMNFIGAEDMAFVKAPCNAEAKRTAVQEGDVLLTITGSKIGRVAPVPHNFGPAFISQHVAIMRLDQTRMLAEFLSYYLSLPDGGQLQIAKNQYGQTKPGLNFDQIGRFIVPDVPIAGQASFVAAIKHVGDIADQVAEALAREDRLFQSLQQRAFRGDL